jgi:hypothetical protein
MLNNTRLISALLVATVLVALSAGDASADTFCVKDDGCDGIPRETLEQALSDAAASGEPDAIQVGPGEFITKTGFNYLAQNIPGNSLTLTGHGAQTVLRADTPAKTGIFRTLRIAGTQHESTVVQDLTIVAPDRPDETGNVVGLALARAEAQRLKITPPPGASIGPLAALVFDEGASGSELYLDGGAKGAAVRAVAGRTVVQDSALIGRFGIWAGPQAMTNGTRVDIRATQVGANTHGGSVSLNDSAVRLTADGAVGIAVSDLAAEVGMGGGHNITIRGLNRPGTIGVRVTAPTATAEATLFNCIIEGVATGVSLGMGQVSAKTDHCNYDATNDAGAVERTAHTNLDPMFVGADDIRLRSESPLLDIANRYTEEPGMVAYDLFRNPRVVDGNGDGVAAADLGAAEYQPTPAAPPSSQEDAPEGSEPVPPVADVTPPAISRLAVRRLRARMTLSEAARLTVRVQRRMNGRWRRVSTKSVDRAGGAASVRLGRLRQGRYRVLVVAVDRAGNRSRVARARFHRSG